MRLRFALMSCLAALPVAAQRLPSNAVPAHYALHLSPDLKAATFAGDETIDLGLAAPSPTITLNAVDLKITSVAASVGQQTQQGTVSYDPDKQQATLTFPAALPAGAVRLSLRFTGVLNNQLRGFYLSKTATRSYAVTQFESTDARRAFPSFDEPALKATFDVSLTVDARDTVIANTNQVSDKPAGPGRHTLTFATTPRMSTYLVAFQVGDFVCSHGSADGIPIGACTTPGKLPLAQLALESAEHFLHYYDTYFGIKYPLPKLDMIAIPDFEAGAMENFGCITYRETDFLVDPKHATLDARKRVAVVVAHEMAHQWFGDLVTMQWWDNLWLNEGFATWMESKAVREWQPGWGLDEDEARVLNSTLNLDAAPTTRAIRSRAETPAEIDQQFDGLSYGKAGAVLSMVEHYVGAEPFRQGVHAYLAAHEFGNATAEDFWNAQTQTSGKPVDRIMESFVAQPGVPLLTFAAPADGHTRVAQSRFFLSPQPAVAAQSWTVPVCTGATGTCQLASGAASTLDFAAAHFLNGDDRGYYRSSYDATTLASILAGAETKLTAPERIGLVGDQWALTRAGSSNVGSFLDLAATLHADRNAAVLESVVGPLSTVRTSIATEDQRKALEAWEVRLYRPVYDALGPVSASETDASRELRADLFALLGSAGDPAVVEQANRLSMRYLAGDHSADAGLALSALDIAAMHGDAALYDKVQRLAETSTNPQEKVEALYTLARFRDPVLVKRTLDYAGSGKVRNQDSAGLYAQELAHRETRAQAWSYVQANWPTVSAQFTASSGRRVVGATGSFCSADSHAAVEAFFTTHPVPNADRTLRAALESIDACVRVQQQQEPSLAEWLGRTR